MPISESRLIEKEITLRSLRLTKEIMETRRSMIRWLALSLGIINPGESRQSALSVLDALLYYQFSLKKDPTVEELSERIEATWGAINEKTLRYHLLQFKKADILNNYKGKYALVQQDLGERYDEVSWISDHLSREISEIKNNISIVLKELKNR